MRSKRMEEVWTTTDYLLRGESPVPIKGRAEALLLYKTGERCYVETGNPNLPYRRLLTKEEAIAELSDGKTVYRRKK